MDETHTVIAYFLSNIIKVYFIVISILKNYIIPIRIGVIVHGLVYDRILD